MAAGAGGADRVPGDGRGGQRDGGWPRSRSRVRRCAAAAARRPRRWLLAFALLGPLGFVALEAGWLVTEWGRQPWIVRGADAHGGRGHRRSRTRRRRSGCSRSSTCCWASRSSICWRGRSGRRQAARSAAAPATTSGACRLSWRSPASIGAALCLYFLFGGADFGGGVWDLLASRPARGRAAPRGRGRHRPGVGGEPRLADPGHRRAVHGFPAGVRGDLGRAARAADAVPDRRRVARLGVRVPRRSTRGGGRSAAWGWCSRWRARSRRVLLGMIVGALVSGRIRVADGIVHERILRGLAGAVPARGRRVRAGAVRAARRHLPDRRGRAIRRCARTSAGARWRRASRSASRRSRPSCSPATARRACARRWRRGAGAGRSTRSPARRR